MEVIIVRLTPYKERDYIVNALSVEGMITFRATGALALKSKFAGKLFLYALVDVELKDSKAGYTLTNVETLNQMSYIFSDYQKIIFLNIFGEIALKTLKDENSIVETFPLFKNVMLALPVTTKLYSLLYLFLANLLRILGLGFVVNRCVYSGRQDQIIGLSYRDGGFVSEKARTNETTLLSPEEIKIVRYAFLINEEQLLRHEFNDEEVLRLTTRLLIHLEETYNFKLISREILK